MFFKWPFKNCLVLVATTAATLALSHPSTLAQNQLAQGRQTDRAEKRIDFNRDIRPILSNACFACHGPDPKTREAGLRLDTFDGATEDLGDYFAVKPGAPDESELLTRVTSDDRYEIMPPPKHGKPLSKQQTDLLEKWIADGAKYSKHWSYTAPVRPRVPNTKSGWVNNEIDEFILRKIRKQKLSPSDSADRLTIIRRLALDLTGLPPTLDQADDFLADRSKNAYENLVDRLLASPSFGERWASVWLDLARYADSAGYAEDRKRTIWAYRDYVIRSLNDNKPFDEFTIEQIAGDLLPDPTTEQLVATAFHRNTLTNSEGGTSDEEFRNAAVVDRVNTTMAVWMGTTMACAQCHTHKYDPITQKEYFRFFAFFNSTADNDQPNEAPVLSKFSESQNEKLTQLKAKLLQKRQQNKLASQVNDDHLNRWAEQLGPSKTATGRFVRVEILNRRGILSLAEVQVFAGDKNVAVDGTATQSSTDYNGPAKLAIDGNTSGRFEDKTVTHSANEFAPWWQVDLGDEYTVDHIAIWNRTGLASRLDGYRVSILDANKKTVWMQDFSKAAEKDQTIEVASPPRDIANIAALDASERNEAQIKLLKEYYLATDSRIAQLSTEIRKIESDINSMKPETVVPIMRELEKKRKTQIQIRGNFQDVGDTVSEGTPKAFHPLPKQKPLNRLTLAKWLVDPQNPLTARVAVNRIWENLFGIGIVSTSEEFGNQGELPSHPELLDYLACELVDSGWDQKALIKKIVMSATYRQSSAASPKRIKQDPTNRWLARGPRNRITAEMIRDQALFASGLLTHKMYGPPVNPPQPKFNLKAAFSGSVDWTDSVGADRYRRAIYTQWRRSAPYPSMVTFDISSREVCEIRRATTNTPLQALVTLNDPVFVEAAQALARRITNQIKNTDQSANKNEPPSEQKRARRIAEHAFRLCLIRKPESRELDRIVQLYFDSKKHFVNDPEAAKLFVTDPMHELPSDSDFVDLAAWTTVANVLLNLDEIFLKP